MRLPDFKRRVDGPSLTEKREDYDPDAAPFREAYLRSRRPRLDKKAVKRGRSLEE